jgi:hypothetical protein
MINLILRKKQNFYEIEAYMPNESVRFRIIVDDQMHSEAAMKRFIQEVSLKLSHKEKHHEIIIEKTNELYQVL